MASLARTRQISPQQADQLRDVVTRLLPAGVQLPTASDSGTLAGGLIGSLILINKDTNQPQAKPNETTAALTGLADGGFVRMPEKLLPGQLAVVLTGAAQAGNGAGDRAATIARFATQIDRSGAGAVLAAGLMQRSNRQDTFLRRGGRSPAYFRASASRSSRGGQRLASVTVECLPNIGELARTRPVRPGRENGHEIAWRQTPHDPAPALDRRRVDHDA